MRARGAWALMLACLGANASGAAAATPTGPPRAEPPAPAAKAAETRELRVLFVGNGLTGSNDLPGMVRKLAKAAKETRPLVAGQETTDGFTLQKHWKSGRFGKALAEQPWEVVVIQEQSEIPSFSKGQRAQMMDPYAEKMHAKVKEAGASTALLLTWGWRDGDRPNLRRDTYEAMQRRLRAGYVDLAEKLLVPIVPVGEAWERAVRERPDVELWAGEQRPSKRGSYLSACVLYGWLYKKSPVGNPFIADLDRSEAAFLQLMAAATLHDWFRTPMGPEPAPGAKPAVPAPVKTKGKAKPRAKAKTGEADQGLRPEGPPGPPPIPDGPRVIVPPRPPRRPAKPAERGPPGPGR